MRWWAMPRRLERKVRLRFFGDGKEGRRKAGENRGRKGQRAGCSLTCEVVASPQWEQK